MKLPLGDVTTMRRATKCTERKEIASETGALGGGDGD
jgi:hypothetical protein